MAASRRKQVAQELEAAAAELASVSQELQSKQVAAGTLDQKMADSEHKLDSLKQSVHALHAEQAAAQHAQAEAKAPLDQTQAQLDAALLQLSSQRSPERGPQREGVGKSEDYSLVAKSCTFAQTDMHSQEEEVGAAMVGADREGQGAVISKSFAAEHDRDYTPKARLESSLRTSIESSGSNHAASHQQDLGGHRPMLQSRDADSVGPDGISAAVPSQTVLQPGGLRAAADVQVVQQLKMHLKEETQRRQQAEQQLLHIQHGSLPATSPQGSPLLATSDLGSALQHDACQSAASDQGTQPQQQSLTRLHRRLQRLQDERIQLEGVLAHERSLLAQQRSDNAQLRSRLAAHSSLQAQNAETHLLHTSYTNVHMGVTTQQHEEGGHAQARQQRSPSIARDHFHPADPDGLHNSQQQQQHATSNSIIPSDQQLKNHLLQLQAELALIESERTALHVNLAAQQAQHDSERAALHAAFAAEREENLHVRQQLDVLSHGRLNDSGWHAHAVQLQAQHADVALELHAAQEQCKACCKQIEDLQASKHCLVDEGLVGKQQTEYLQRQLEGCQQELRRMQSQEHNSKDEVELSLAAQQHDLLLTQQAFHAKQVQFEDVRQQLLDCQEDQQQLQQQLQASQHDSSCLQSSLAVTTAAKQEAEALCLQLHEEVGRLQGQVAGMRHSISLCQSQQLELQSGGSQLESMQLLLTDARQHAADLQADNSHLQHTQDSLQKALAQARQQIAQLQADMEGEEQHAAAAEQAQKKLEEKVHMLEQAAQQSSDKLTLQQQLTTAQTDLAAAEQALQELSQKAALASTESQTVEDSKDRQQLAAEKKLLKAEVASLKRRAAEELAVLRVIQKEHAQEPQAAKAAAFYKGALLRLSDTLLDTLKHIRHMRDKLLQSAQSVRKFALSNEVQQCLTLLESVVSTLQHSAQSCLLSSSNRHP